MNTECSYKAGPTTDIRFGVRYDCDNSRRKHSRTRMKLPVQFELAGGPVISAATNDLSMNGMQIRCEHHHIGQLVDFEASGSRVSVLVVMRLQVGNRLSSQVLRCHLSYLKKSRADEMLLGLQFDALLPDQQLALLSVLEQAHDTAVRN